MVGDCLQVKVLNVQDKDVTLEYRGNVFIAIMFHDFYDYSNIKVGNEIKVDISRSIINGEYRIEATRDIIW